uniref:Glycosyl transferase, group 1 n=1 Tax=Rhodopseudomonas palustris (strain BisA53) TaxID=316055 RepID=Q07IQ9_RHOP5
MRKLVWPVKYSWYQPLAKRLRGSGRITAVLARFVGIERAADLRARFASRPLSPRAERLAAKGRTFRFLVPPLFRLYSGLRHGRPNLSVPTADALLRKHGVEVVHFPYPHFFPTSIPFVYEPWGLPHIHQPELFGAEESVWMDRLFRSGCGKAAMIVTASRWVKDDIVKQYGIAPHRIAVIPRVPSLPSIVPDATGLPSNLPQRFALFPSVTWPSKNHIRLVRALALLRDQRGLKVQLVCTGANDTPHWKVIEAEIAALNISDQVHFLGVVKLEQLIALYKSASYLVHPSTFEGLGLPLLEAFQHGLPVLSSTSACKPEVVGDAALLFDAFDEADIARCIAKAEDDPGLLEQLRTRGTRRIDEHFPSPKKMADMFLALYRHAAQRELDTEQQLLVAEMLAP